MGIKCLHKFLKHHVEHIYRIRPFTAYQGRTLAVDINLYLYHFKTKHRQRWVSALFNMIVTLRRHGIQLVFIYDTKAPIEKETKQLERKMKKQHAEKRMTEIRDALTLYEDNGQVETCLTDIMDKRHPTVKKLLSPSPEVSVVDASLIQTELDQLQNQMVNITRYDVQLSKQLLDILAIPTLDSPNEAETMCSHLCVHGLVDGVLSNDTDVLVYGTPIFLTRMSLHLNSWTEIVYTDVLEGLGLTADQFRDFCILCGTDYNKNIPRIGPEKAYKLMLEHGSIEGIREATSHDTSILNHERIREIFRVPDELPPTNLTNGQPKWSELASFAAKYHIYYDVETLQSIFH
jgi:5'-3' exonuclease